VTSVNDEHVKVPQERLAIIIGTDGETKELIEQTMDVDLYIDTDDSSVHITDRESTDDPLAVWKTRDIIKAVARGINPQKALRLKEDGTIVEIIDVSEYVGGSKNSLLRLKGRIIGKEGKTRRIIESMTGVTVSIYGKTVAVLGTYDEVYDAKRAIAMLLEGKPHSGVYRFLEKSHKERKEREFLERLR
jgi:ribosomal RNA assembly protein